MKLLLVIFFLVRLIIMLIYEHHVDCSPHHNPYMIQAWGFASGVRSVLGKNPLMNMENYPYDVWTLHRKLFHRFLKYKKYFVKATESLPEYQKAKEVKMEVEPVPTPKSSVSLSHHVVCLLSSSEEEVSEDDVSDEGTDTNSTSVKSV